MLVAVLLLASACGGPVQSMVEGDNKIKAKPDRVALAPTQFYYEHFDVSPEGEEMFDTNLAVGYLNHVGGYIEVPGEDGVGTIRRSRKVEVKRHEKYRKEISQLIQRAFEETIRNDKKRVVRVESENFPQKQFKPEKRKQYAAPSEDGKDNVNVPYLDVEPTYSIEEMPDVKADIIVVPYVVYYYVHNRGWHHGQRWGNPAGGRFRLMWSAYDVSTGELLGWSDIDLKLVEEKKFHPNQSEIETYRAELHESMFEKWIRKTLKL
jgi:hypothetical protein